jgi:hypothetical protein
MASVTERLEEVLEREAPAWGIRPVVLLVGESDQAMANIHSSAVSIQNVRPRFSQRWLIVATGALSSCSRR